MLYSSTHSNKKSGESTALGILQVPVVVAVPAGQGVEAEPLHELAAEDDGQPLVVDDVLPLGHHDSSRLLQYIKK